MRIEVVIGANYGDEGKGRLTYELARRHVAKNYTASIYGVLTNGGPQRGHRVVMPTAEGCIEHVFRHLSSASLQKARTVIPSTFLVDPIMLDSEMLELDHKLHPLGLCIQKPLISEDAMLITPYDVILNQLTEIKRGVARHGSVGCGIWETIQRSKKLPIRIGSVWHSKDLLYQALVEVRDYFDSEFHSRGLKVYPEWKSHFDDGFKTLDELFVTACLSVRMHSEPLDPFKMARSPEVLTILESGQGLLLDESLGDEYQTPSKTGAEGVIQVLKELRLCEVFKDVEKRPLDKYIYPQDIIIFNYVTRTYLTRHGAGPMEDECFPWLLGDRLGNEPCNKTNTFQGHFRYGRLDPEKLIERVTEDYKKTDSIQELRKTARLCVTHCDELDTREELRQLNSIYRFSPIIWIDNA